MLRIGLSSCGKNLTSELFSEYSKNGISEIEISTDIDGYRAMDYSLIAEFAKASSVNLYSLHLPFNGEIDISNPVCAKETLAIHEDIIEKASEIGVGLFIIHPSAEPIEDSERADRMALSVKNLKHLTEFAEMHGARLAVENLPRTCLGRNSEEMLILAGAHEKLGVCFDTNHLLSEDPIKFIKALGGKITSTHVSDYDFINERHWLPGEGKLDFYAIYKALKEVGFGGAWLYELGFVPPKTIIRERNLTCADFKKNALEIFEGKPLTVIGTPKENLGM